jgi:hypothetical protein
VQVDLGDSSDYLMAYLGVSLGGGMPRGSLPAAPQERAVGRVAARKRSGERRYMLI